MSDELAGDSQAGKVLPLDYASTWPVTYLYDKETGSFVRTVYSGDTEYARSHPPSQPIAVGTIRWASITTFTYSMDGSHIVSETPTVTYPTVWDGERWRDARGWRPPGHGEG